MKTFKNSLHILLTLASLLGFLGGWATLAHSRKPIQTVSDQPPALESLAPLAPLPALDSNNTGASNSPLNIITSPTRRSRSRSMFSTGGS
jgi:hypothetical protein